ncbi:cytochrome c oxidase subunit 3 [Ramlibacter sp.]|uniref:cytochrome c oxidase subunit 3 n=1 Tax=Ramlibacter sp. TaxID=1917967 RepID=UPI002BF78F7C|nr:cytochrome c oxidase subunit 3 [Ramlibacter sp.]HWI84006.1 cytochrome c oxidase subunit 3 [Ramlibacter sp.]
MNRAPSQRSLDVSRLPSYKFGHHSLMWWGTLGMIAIEGTVFALVIMSYFYLRSHSSAWPMSVLPPDLLWGTVNTLVMVASAVPNHLAKKAAEAHDARGVRLWVSVALAFGVVFLGVRVLEFATLNVRWDSSAYGSVVWTLLGFHTAHLATDVADTVVLAVLFFTGPITGKRFVDVSENAMYWYFVVWVWLPIYFTIYWGARAW